MQQALILGCDFGDKDARTLGPQTILRLKRGLTHHCETGDTLVVAASFSPDFPTQRQSMAELMARWLCERGIDYDDLIVLRAPTFDTRGELRAFYSLPAERYTLISAPWHLRRARVIAREEASPEQFAVTKFVPVPADRGTIKVRLQEPFKWLMLHLPSGWHQACKHAWRRLLGNPSY